MLAKQLPKEPVHHTPCCKLCLFAGNEQYRVCGKPVGEQEGFIHDNACLGLTSGSMLGKTSAIFEINFSRQAVDYVEDQVEGMVSWSRTTKA
jgi:hypothetical protein